MSTAEKIISIDMNDIASYWLFPNICTVYQQNVFHWHNIIVIFLHSVFPNLHQNRRVFNNFWVNSVSLKMFVPMMKSYNRFIIISVSGILNSHFHIQHPSCIWKHSTNTCQASKTQSKLLTLIHATFQLFQINIDYISFFVTLRFKNN